MAMMKLALSPRKAPPENQKKKWAIIVQHLNEFRFKESVYTQWTGRGRMARIN